VDFPTPLWTTARETPRTNPSTTGAYSSGNSAEQARNAPCRSGSVRSMSAGIPYEYLPAATDRIEMLDRYPAITPDHSPPDSTQASTGLV
jgi:hypothetical protein